MSKNPVNDYEILEIYTDGASRGNPGPAAYAYLYVQSSKILRKKSAFIGKATNNVAEYQAIINALKDIDIEFKGRVRLYSDSNLAIQQINNRWKVNYPHLLKLRAEVYRLVKKFEEIEFSHSRRSNRYVQICDSLCNERLDNKRLD